MQWRSSLRPASRTATRWARLRARAVSAAVGAGATGVDLAVLAICVGPLGLPARAANLPALLGGALVQFFGNRHLAFRATEGSMAQQAGWFALAELVALALNALLYDLVARRVALGPAGAMLLRLVCSGLVFVLWSYPLWQRIFRDGRRAVVRPREP